VQIGQDLFANGEVTLTIDYGKGKRVDLRFLYVGGASDGEGTAISRRRVSRPGRTTCWYCCGLYPLHTAAASPARHPLELTCPGS